MSINYTAEAILGVILPETKDLPRAKILVRKKAFYHTYKDDGEVEFHPRTGQKLFLDDEKEEVLGPNPAIIYDIYDEYIKEKSPEILIKAPRGYEFACYQGEIYCLGVCIENRDNAAYGFKKVPDTEVIKKVLKDLLQPHGLWDEENFGLHVILHCS